MKDAIAAGDFINHAIFTGAELCRALAKPAGAGYIKEMDGSFLLSGDAAAFRAPIAKSKESAGKLAKTFCGSDLALPKQLECCDEFRDLGGITATGTIAARTGIRDIKRLRRNHGKGRWRKLKGAARVRLDHGRIDAQLMPHGDVVHEATRNCHHGMRR